MIIGLVGLHGCGKSHLSHILEREFGWVNANKRELLEGMFSKKFPSPESQEAMDWYRHMYQSYGASRIMELVLEVLPRETPVILDAIHNPREWSVIKNNTPKSMLVGVFAPQAVRAQRNSPQDALLDIKRAKYWHEHDEESSVCLMSEVEWVFTGAGSPEHQRAGCAEFMNYLRVAKYLE